MGIFDKLKNMGAGREDPERLGAKESFSGAFLRVPSELHASVESIAKESHFSFRDRFPEYTDFLDAVAECWLRQVEGFRDEMASLGFTEVPPGTKASQLNASTLAILTESGSLLFVGPGAFEKEGKGASLKYTKIPLRSDSFHTPPTPRKRKDLYSPQLHG